MSIPAPGVWSSRPRLEILGEVTCISYNIINEWYYLQNVDRYNACCCVVILYLIRTYHASHSWQRGKCGTKLTEKTVHSGTVINIEYNQAQGHTPTCPRCRIYSSAVPPKYRDAYTAKNEQPYKGRASPQAVLQYNSIKSAFSSVKWVYTPCNTLAPSSYFPWSFQAQNPKGSRVIDPIAPIPNLTLPCLAPYTSRTLTIPCLYH